MKHKINILFESDPEAAGIEVRICAPERDEYVEALIERISDQPPETLTVTGEYPSTPEGAVYVPFSVIVIGPITGV